MSDDASLAALKPCPFCGGGNILTHAIRDGRQAKCSGCGAAGRPQFHGPSQPFANERARASWNTRAADQRCAELEAENARLREALAKDATRFEACAGMIEQSFNASGTLRAERTMKAKHFALEALSALENRDD